MNMCLLSSVNAAEVSNKPSFPTVIYWDNWTDQKGISHLTKCRITAFHPISSPQNTSPKESTDNNAQAFIWDGVKHNGKGYATVTTVVQPAKWTSKWENTPHVQWIIPLSGTYFIQAMDGTRIELNAGDVLLNEDIGSIRDKNGHQGHIYGTIGNNAIALLNLQFTALNSPTHKPCAQE